MKIGVIFFHKNIKSIYKERWINKCIETILNQTVKDFSIYEINYGGDNFSLFEKIELKNPYTFISEEKSNHAEAMNRIIDLAFEDGCEYVFNTNLDDYYELNRFEKQIEFLDQGYDIVTSDFCYVEEIGNDDKITFYKEIKKSGDIRENLMRNHNVIAHPCVSYTKKFWESNRYDIGEIPEEDLNLWKRSIENGFKFHICDDVLLNYRLHDNQVTGSNSYMAIQIEGDRRREEAIRRAVYGNSSQVNSTGPMSLR
jgi:hypothetical protein